MVTKPRAALQTYHAIQASDLAAAFNDALKRVRIVPGDYIVELTAPEGPSTGGGVQALQHIRIVPRQPGHATIVVGHANHAEEWAELRTYEHLDSVYRQRFKRPLAIDRGQYEDFVQLAKQILEALHLETAIVGPPPEEAPPPSRSKWMIAWGFAIAVALAGLGLWRVLGKG
jgi:hypothetical protein